MALYEVLGRGHHVTEKGKQRMAAVGEIVELSEQAAAPFVPWRLKRREGLEAEADEAAAEMLAAEAEALIEESKTTDATNDETAPPVNAHYHGPVTDSARALADEHGISLSAVKGTGKGGRITQPDVEHAIGNPTH